VNNYGTNIPGILPYLLTVTPSPQAGGTITSIPSGLAYADSTYNGSFSGNVLLVASPSTNYAFAYWAEGTNQTIGDSLSVSMSGNKALTAKFIHSLKWPLSGSKSSRTTLLSFGQNWVESCGGQVMKHAGLDVSATESEEVKAAADGIVVEVYTGQHAQWADAIVIKHSSDSFTTVYWHVNSVVSVNDSVTKGEKIGTVANLGSNTHFHFGIRDNPFLSGKSDKGALPQSDCGGNPAFPEYFVDPDQSVYD
jgi:murein DD-endopeptidase MepM/ murein hydrolase activator NlpD